MPNKDNNNWLMWIIGLLGLGGLVVLGKLNNIQQPNDNSTTKKFGCGCGNKSPVS